MTDQFEQEIIDKVEEHGWFALSVAPRADSDKPEEWWTYTIGLPKSHDWPEIIVFGQDSKTSHGILWDAINECETKNIVPHIGLVLTDTLNGYDATLVDGSPISDHYFGTATWFARHNGLPSPPNRLQLMWPDRNGHFPFDPDCNEEVRSLQTPKESE